MATYMEYELEDGTSVCIAVTETGGLVPAGAGDVVRKAKIKFEEALTAIKPWAGTLRRQLSDLKADEVKVKFGLTVGNEVGNFAVGKLGAEGNFEVSLKWINKPKD